MITPMILYKQMKNWVNPTETNSLAYIHFDGERAKATNGYGLAIVKNWPTDVHLETVDGLHLPNKNAKFPNYENLLIEKKRISWQFSLNDPSSITDLCKCWKQVFTFLRSMLRRPKAIVYPVTLQIRYGKFYVYAANDALAVKFVLLEGQKCENWEHVYSAVYLLNAVEFLLATSPKELRIYNSRSNAYQTLFIETEELLLIIAGAKLKADNDSWIDRHLRFLEEERPKEKSPETTEKDFLD